MDNIRRGEIAYLLLKEKARHDGLHLKKGLRRELGNWAKETGIPLEELIAFMTRLLHEIVDDTFAAPVDTSTE